MPSVSFVAASLVLGTACISWMATARMRFRFTPLHPGSVWHAFVEPFANPTFVPLISAYVIAYIGIGVNAATFLYYYDYVLGLTVAQRQTVLAVFLATFTVSILAWVWLARRYGKLRPLVLGAFVVGVANTALYTLVPAQAFAWVLALGGFGIGSFVGAIVLLDTLLTDVLDHDRLTSRQLRAGLFFGVWRFASKVARAITLAVVGAVLGAAGFVEKSTTQPPSVHDALVVMFAPGVGVTFLIACWILWRYRFDDAKQAQVRRLLARRDARAR
jgi:GPH family glycoside/pentoside/hexuronide:cation symporter